MFRQIVCTKETCPYSHNIGVIEEKIDELFTNCCSSENIKQSMKTNLLLEQVLVNVKKIEKDMVLDKKEHDEKYMILLDNVKQELSIVKKENETFRRYVNYFIGAVSIIYFFGIDGKISGILFGG